ncbi:MAG TPA: hypothetical protein VN132_14925, partial [Bdellovibrio sp.]|nr:hypothetical protein [Bdellovibrio sp.]
TIMQEELGTYLSVALKKLEQAYNELMNTQPYNPEAEKLKLLAELVKEQVQNENSRTPTR